MVWTPAAAALRRLGDGADQPTAIEGVLSTPRDEHLYAVGGDSGEGCGTLRVGDDALAHLPQESGRGIAVGLGESGHDQAGVGARIGVT